MAVVRHSWHQRFLSSLSDWVTRLPHPHLVRPLISSATARLFRKGKVEFATLATVLALAGMLLGFAHLTYGIIEGETGAFDHAVLMAMRTPNAPNNPLGPPWFEEAVRDVGAPHKRDEAAPRGETLVDGHDGTLAGAIRPAEEHSINREPHEHHVNAVAARQPQRGSGGQRRPPHEALELRPQAGRVLDALREDGAPRQVPCHNRGSARRPTGWV